MKCGKKNHARFPHDLFPVFNKTLSKQKMKKKNAVAKGGNAVLRSKKYDVLPDKTY